MKPLLDQDPHQPPMHSSQYASLPPVYVQNASLEIARTRVVFESRSISGTVIRPFLTQGFEGVDINEPKDVWYAEHLIQRGEAALPSITEAAFR